MRIRSSFKLSACYLLCFLVIQNIMFVVQSTRFLDVDDNLRMNPEGLEFFNTILDLQVSRIHTSLSQGSTFLVYGDCLLLVDSPCIYVVMPTTIQQ